MRPNRMQTRIASQHYQVRTSGRVGLENSCDILANGVEKADHRAALGSRRFFSDSQNLDWEIILSSPMNVAYRMEECKDTKPRTAEDWFPSRRSETRRCERW